MSLRGRRGVALACTLAAVGGLAGCGTKAAPGAGARLRITEQDFAIHAPHVVRAGEVELSVHNRGPDTHELIVVRAGDPKLPLRADGMTVDEDAVEPSTLGSVDDNQPGHTGDTSLRLTPGRYVLFCNMFGHYRGGMHTELVVTPA
jgi:uncharacterized cupredoxin-like copper-binding protein